MQSAVPFDGCTPMYLRAIRMVGWAIKNGAALNPKGARPQLPLPPSSPREVRADISTMNGALSVCEKRVQLIKFLLVVAVVQQVCRVGSAARPPLPCAALGQRLFVALARDCRRAHFKTSLVGDCVQQRGGHAPCDKVSKSCRTVSALRRRQGEPHVCADLVLRDT